MFKNWLFSISLESYVLVKRIPFQCSYCFWYDIWFLRPAIYAQKCKVSNRMNVDEYSRIWIWYMYDRAHYILQKTCDRARRDRYKNVKLQLNSKGCHGLMCADCIPWAKMLWLNLLHWILWFILPYTQQQQEKVVCIRKYNMSRSPL